MSDFIDSAPGAPGISPRWTSSAKEGVGTALSPDSPIWFTLSHGIVNEVYYPRVDSACIRDFGLVITGPNGAFFEEKRHATSVIASAEPGVPAFQVVNKIAGAFRIEKDLITDPDRPVLLTRVTFSPLSGNVESWHVHALISPHLVNAGAHNSAWLGRYDGHEVLFAKGRGRYLALASSLGWRARSAGYVGGSDGWQQLRARGRLEPQYARADDGNVALTGEIAFAEETREAVLALGFGQTEHDAAARALASLEAGFDAAWDGYVAGWQMWQGGLASFDGPLFRQSAAVLSTHRAADRPGAAVASLSIPWGFSRGDDDLGGYHLIWPRDLVETAGGFLAAGDGDEALAILGYLAEVQLPSGRWPQNLWLDGEPYWHGVQMDEVALPILLADLLMRKGVLDKAALKSFLPMLQGAAGFLLMHGPATAQGRWEENAGYSPYTLATEITGLLAAADLFDAAGAPGGALLREVADCWNEQVEAWTYVAGDALSDTAGVAGHYVRFSAPAPTDEAKADTGTTTIKNHDGPMVLPSRNVLSPDALALVRFGLRAPDDPRITDTVAAIDRFLRAEFAQGPLWYRYTDDGYGEHEDGSPFDGTGRGRPWPLLAGERAHYELAAGNVEAAKALLATLESSAGRGGMLPEQVWDGPDLPARELFHGGPTGSAMPLAWAHAEHIKLLRSLADGAVFDTPPQGRARYVEGKQGSDIRIWRFDNQITHLPAGKKLRFFLGARAGIRWSGDGWANVQDTETAPTGFGSHWVDLPVADLAPGAAVDFTFFWIESGTWEHRDFRVAITRES